MISGEIQEEHEEASKQLEKDELPRMQDEAKLSIAEIIARRFKSKIKQITASSPQEVQSLIIKPGSAANDVDAQWLVSFFDETRYPAMNGTLAKLFKSITNKVPTLAEL